MDKQKIVTGILLAGGSFLLYKVGKKLWNDYLKSQAQNSADEKPAVRWAMLLRSAINPSSISWLKQTDGTNEEAIFSIAKQITKLDEVASAYKDLYQDNLFDDLQRELSLEDYQKVLNIVTSSVNRTGGATEIYASKGNLIVTKKDVYLRTSPDASSHGAIYESNKSNNIFRLAKAGEFIGYATGKQQYDEKNNVKFIEVGYLIKGDAAPASLKKYNGKQFKYWVSSSASYVDIFKNYAPFYAAYPKIKNTTTYMKPLDFYGTLKGISSELVISKTPCNILDESFDFKAMVAENILLGKNIMSIQNVDKRWVQFLTIDGNLRWVDSSKVRITRHD
ncbi:MAG: annexin [Sphingobacteriales bacterium]|nr:annexin [Sphingobacteriales bacterium]